MKIRFFKPFFSEYPPKLLRVMAILGVSVPESKKRKPQQRHGLLKFKNLPCRAGTCPTAVVRTINVGRDDSARRCRNYRVRTNSLPMSLRGVTRRGNLVQDHPFYILSPILSASAGSSSRGLQSTLRYFRMVAISSESSRTCSEDNPCVSRNCGV